MFRRIRQQRDLPGAFDRPGQDALVFGTGARTASRMNASGIRDVLLQQSDVFVVDMVDLFGAELADFATTASTTGSPAAATRAAVE